MKIVHSGGAKGTDALFGQLAVRNKMRVIHHSFPGHKLHALAGEVRKHAPEDLESQCPLLDEAAEHLGRKIPNTTYKVNLLLRNGFQIQHSKLVVAAASVEDAENCRVEGGTGWAVAMAYLRGMPILVFDLDREQWMYSLKGSSLQPVSRKPDMNRFPMQWAGIGSREITAGGRAAVEQLFATLTRRKAYARSNREPAHHS
jgi:hypothetical protein